MYSITRNHLRQCVIAIAISGMAVFAAACEPDRKEEAFRPIAVGEAVPEFTVRTLAGDSARIAPGEPVTLLNVWATWCGP